MSELISALLRPESYPHPVQHVRLIETHISWVLLAGEFAYKLKKPLNLGFLDFSTLDRRRFCCEEEIRLNRRLAPETYLDVQPITGDKHGPIVGGTGRVLEWAVRMQAFPEASTLDRATTVTPDQIDAIADRIAAFHRNIDTAPASGPLGTPEAVMHPVRENFNQVRELLAHPLPEALPELEQVAHWSELEGTRLQDHFQQRLAQGFVRECHGDLHLGNIAWVNDAPLIFDCIEFNPALRFIDIISEVAFLFMDLAARGSTDLAWRFINRWLEQTGDHAGLAALRFYLVYRAMVRLKVASIRFSQGDRSHEEEIGHYLDLALALSRQAPTQLILMHGYSGSGKTWLSQRLLETLGAIRIRSDVERKRLFGLEALADSTAAKRDIYTAEANQKTLEHLLALGRSLLDFGYSVIADATFLAKTWRRPFQAMAVGLERPLRIVSLVAPPEVLRRRVTQRETRADDASEAGVVVLEAQMKNAEPFAGDELESVFAFDSDNGEAWPQLLDFLTVPPP